ncbi:MAG: MurR/RpiR family transcriptional regulator [Oscillospiraceae bacterium]|nr:MurR/RpiR family transcriptional regulator [Oscillospiraceae bacterium]
MNVVEKINQCYDEMTKSERHVASFFLGHFNDFAFYTLDKIAAEIGTSTTTVIRFCRRLGFEGFKGFQEALRNDLKYQQPDLPDKFQRTLDTTINDELLSQTIQRDIRCIQHTFHNIPYESLAATVRMICGAKRVFTFGMKESYALSHYAYTRFLTVRNDVYMLPAGNGDIESLLSLTEEDVCIVYLFHRYTKQTLQLLPMLKDQGVKIIIVTSEPYDKVEKYATLLLPCRVDANGIKNSAVAPICLANYLCNAVAVFNGEKTLNYMRKSEQLFKIHSILGS